MQEIHTTDHHNYRLHFPSLDFQHQNYWHLDRHSPRPNQGRRHWDNHRLDYRSQSQNHH